ncbi:M4 family peptidase [Arthrobacter crusticola]|uniref:Neutral metalloproteinase n=1 Tax=Arthrobacter crusticola TaxID=2547960 RepID=A0A4R5TW84_9MICC|nr:M4 family metallopeptidase [Arthrobacter crusticola]TDK25394.1 M4 family peptidase [Arthrobacter crusticola]
MHPHPHCSIVPPHLLAHLAAVDDPRHAVAARAARRALVQLDPLLADRAEAFAAPVPPRTAVGRPLERRISDAGGQEILPGTLIRGEGDGATGDEATDEAYDGLGATDALFREVYGRASIDDAGLPLAATVHYGQQYDNAFWDGERMVFGDGDGDVFGRFTRSLTVISHELTHGFTQYSTNLVYEGQPGALNESLSDVFGVLVEQHHLRQTVDQASWLVGEGVFTDQVQGQALRSLAAPGTAYDDDVLGRDPQPATMSDFVITASDNGGVHINSGIPNHAFYLTALHLGGYAWERAGRIWFDAAVGGGIQANSGFRLFADVTQEAARARFGQDSEEYEAVRQAWAKVEVTG